MQRFHDILENIARRRVQTAGMDSNTTESTASGKGGRSRHLIVSIEPSGLDCAGEIGIAPLGPLFAGLTTAISLGARSQGRQARNVKVRSPPSRRQRAAFCLTGKTTNSMGPSRSRAEADGCRLVLPRVPGGNGASPIHLR